MIRPSVLIDLEPALPRPRLGFLGVGWIGRNRLEAVSRSGVAEIAAVADNVSGVLDDVRAAAPAVALHGSLDALLEMPLDGLVIATPSALHADQAIAALERGVAVFCQKPLARTGPETRRVVDAARAADRLLGVDFSYRHTDAMVRVRETIGAGVIGEVYAANLLFHNAYGPDKTWFYDKARSGGGCIMDLGIHLIDLVLWTLGNPRVVDVSSRLLAGGKPMRPGGVEDFAAVQLTLDTGAVVQLGCSWRLPAGYDAVIEASFYGTRGGVALHNVNGSFYDFTAEHYTGTYRTTLTSPPDDWGGRAVVDWARRLAAGARFDAEVERAVEVAAVIDTIYARATERNATATA